MELRDAESALIRKSGLERADSSVSKQDRVCVCVVQVHMVVFLVSYMELDKAALLQTSGYNMQSHQHFKPELRLAVFCLAVF